MDANYALTNRACVLFFLFLKKFVCSIFFDVFKIFYHAHIKSLTIFCLLTLSKHIQRNTLLAVRVLRDHFPGGLTEQFQRQVADSQSEDYSYWDGIGQQRQSIVNSA